MGIMIVQKSDLKNPKPNPKFALVLSGGGVSGGAFKLGGLMALNNFMIDKDIREFDIFVGVSAGALLSTFLANGVPTEELLKSMEGRPGMINPLMASEFYRLNFHDFIMNPIHMVMDLITLLPRLAINLVSCNNFFRKTFRTLIFNFIKNPNYENIEAFVKQCILNPTPLVRFSSMPWEYIPNGVFITDGLEKSVRKSLAENHLYNDFKELYDKRGKSLYIYATNLDAHKRIVFGHDKYNEFDISKAVQASVAVPIFYKPVKFGDSYYVDGGVINTSGMDVAVEKGADLIIVYNPFRPFNYESFLMKYKDKRKRYCLADDGMYTLINQVFRTLLHTRLLHGIDRYRKSPTFKGDIILIEPTDYDDQFFDMNPLAFWERRKASKRGYQSVKASITENYEQLRDIMTAYGITTSLEFAKDDVTTQKESLETNESLKN